MNVTTCRAADVPASTQEAPITTWHEAADHDWGGCRNAPPEFVADMLATLARVYGEVEALHERFQSLPDHHVIEPAGETLSCLMQDVSIALSAVVRTAQGKPSNQQTLFEPTLDCEPCEALIDGRRFVVEAMPRGEVQGSAYYRLGLVAHPA